MYRLAKKIVTKLISNNQLFRYEVYLRNIYALFYTGTKHQCPVCHKKLSSFITMPKQDIMCPKCGSIARDRRLWTLLKEEFIQDGFTVLDFSPSRPLARKMKAINNIEYRNTDLSGNFIADYRYDITNLDIPDNTIDLIVCYHILEHIDNDKKAMSELYRVLKPGGKAIVQTPFKEGDIYEDFTITDPQQREIHFGQDDHVRIYSVNGLKERLELAGFTADARTYKMDEYQGLLDNETIFILTKA